jgi:hypothetical protein
MTHFFFLGKSSSANGRPEQSWRRLGHGFFTKTIFKLIIVDFTEIFLNL